MWETYDPAAVATKIELVQQALSAIRAGDLEQAREHLATDFVWHIPGTSTISGDTRGAEETAARFTRLVDAGLRPEVITMLEGPDHACFFQRNRASIEGHELDVHVLNLFEIRGGKVARMDTFFSDQPALEDFWNAVLPQGWRGSHR
jgi:ketosteroid isomerase-like protein